MTDRLDPKTTALLLMDLQRDILDSLPDASRRDTLLARASALLARARNVGARVVHVGLGFRPGYPELPAQTPFAAMVRASGRFVAGTPGAEFHAGIAPQGDEVRVTKHRVSAFAGTDLDLVLRANRIDTLVLAGVSTSGIVLSTARYAADADYRLILAEDCCTDRDDEVHRVLTQKIFPRQASVVSSSEIFAA
jgi:nicotinamidase-related amidase